MSFSVEKMADEPAILIQLNPDFDASKESQAATEKAFRLVSEQTAPTFMIWDTRESPPSVEAFIMGGSVTRAVEPPAPYHGSIVISAEPIVKTAMQGMNSRAFGNLVIPVFENLDEARDYMHQQLEDSH